jgi:hypothetical protein
MDWLTKQKTYIWLVIILVVINLITLVLLWVGHPGPPPFTKNDRPDTNRFLKNELGLSDDQEKMFIQIRKTHFDSTDSLNIKLRLKRRSIQEEAFKNIPDTQMVNILSEEIGALQAINENIIFNHFLELKKVLNKEQLEKFKNIISKKEKNRPQPFDGERLGPPPQPDGMPPPEH